MALPLKPFNLNRFIKEFSAIWRDCRLYQYNMKGFKTKLFYSVQYEEILRQTSLYNDGITFKTFQFEAFFIGIQYNMTGFKTTSVQYEGCHCSIHYNVKGF